MGNLTGPEMCYVWLKISISNNSCQYYFIIASVGFNIDHATSQHTPTCACVEKCTDSKSHITVYLHFTGFPVNSVITLQTTYFLNRELSIWL